MWGVRKQSEWDTNGMAACGWILEGAVSTDTKAGLQWVPLLHGCVFLGGGLSSFEAELAGVEGLASGIAYLNSLPLIVGSPQQWFASHVIDEI